MLPRHQLLLLGLEVRWGPGLPWGLSHLRGPSLQPGPSLPSLLWGQWLLRLLWLPQLPAHRLRRWLLWPRWLPPDLGGRWDPGLPEIPEAPPGPAGPPVPWVPGIPWVPEGLWPQSHREGSSRGQEAATGRPGGSRSRGRMEAGRLSSVPENQPSYDYTSYLKLLFISLICARPRSCGS